MRNRFDHFNVYFQGGGGLKGGEGPAGPPGPAVCFKPSQILFISFIFTKTYKDFYILTF